MSEANAFPRVIVTNGFKNFHLSSAASEADRRGALVAFYFGFYPKRLMRLVIAATGLDRINRFGKLL